MRTEHAYSTPESVAKKDAELIAIVEKDAERLEEGIKKMRDTMRAKFDTCNVIDIVGGKVLIVSGETGKYVVVVCRLRFNMPGRIAYYIGGFAPGCTLENTMKQVERIIYV